MEAPALRFVQGARSVGPRARGVADVVWAGGGAPRGTAPRLARPSIGRTGAEVQAFGADGAPRIARRRFAPRRPDRSSRRDAGAPRLTN